MMNELLQPRIVYSTTATDGGANGPVVFTTTGNKFVFSPVAPARLLKWGILIDDTALVTGGSSLVMKLDKRITAGSDTGIVSDIDTLTVTDPSSAYVLGTGAYRDPFTASTKGTTAQQVTAAGPPGVDINIESGQAQFTLKAGEQWVVEVDTGATTSGKGKIWIEYVLLPISKPSGYGTTDAGTVSLTENLTRLAS